MLKRICALPTLSICLCLALYWLTWQVQAQTTKAKPKPKPTSPATVKTIDTKAEKLQETFIKETTEIAKEYEEAGQLERAKTLYDTLVKMDVNLPGLKEKLTQLNDQLLSTNEFDIDLDAGRGWTTAIAMVFKDKPLRIQVDGEYRFMMNASLSADGFETDDLAKDLSTGGTCGAVIGMIITNKTQGKVFQVGKNKDYTPKEDGFLVLRVNAPNGHKCTGKLKVRISGNAKATS